MTSQKAKILLVDDRTLILQGIKHVVSQMPEIEKVYTASSGAEAMLLIDIQPFGGQSLKHSEYLNLYVFLKSLNMNIF